MEDKLFESNSAIRADNLKYGENINTKKYCRICLSQFDLGIPLFEPSVTLNNSTAASLIWNCFNIKLHEQNVLPSQICNECALNILISHNFKIQLQQSHKLLQTKFPYKEDLDLISVTRIDENIYHVKLNDNEDDKNYWNLVNRLKIAGEIKIEEENSTILIIEKAVQLNQLQQLNNSMPQNVEEASKWLKLVKQTGPPYTCKICNHTYKSQYPTFYAHVRMHFAVKKQCALCSVRYLPIREKYHMLKHTKEKSHVCTYCSKSFAMKNHLNQHLKFNCQVNKETSCKMCDKIFSSYKVMHSHMLKEHGACQHEAIKNCCEICNKGKANKNICEYCGAKVAQYKRHLNVCKAAPITTKFQLQNASTCNECGELCFTNYQLKNHMEKHKENRNVSCSICGQVFLQKRYLKDHMEIHKPGKYPCSQCGKIFKRQILLKVHKRTHLEIRKHKCETCEKSFKTRNDLRKHIVIHGQIKPHQCKICGKKFNFKGNLNQHLLSHIKVKYFVCGICKKTFAAPGNLKQHMATHKTHFETVQISA